MVEYKPLEVDQEIKFIPLTENYGRAKFDFCPVYKKSKLMKIFITPRQQNLKGGWVIEINNNSKHQEIIIKSWDNALETFRKFGIALNVWYCKTHKTISFNIPTPEGTNILVCNHIGSDVFFEFKEGGK